MAVLGGLPILLSFNKATDDVVWGLQVSKAACALICGQTFTDFMLGSWYMPLPQLASNVSAHTLASALSELSHKRGT
jgi:hypothetical protein